MRTATLPPPVRGGSILPPCRCDNADTVFPEALQELLIPLHTRFIMDKEAVLKEGDKVRALMPDGTVREKVR